MKISPLSNKLKNPKFIAFIVVTIGLAFVAYTQMQPGGKLFVLQNQLMHKYCEKTAKPDISNVNLSDVLNLQKGILFRNIGVSNVNTRYYGKSVGCYSEIEVKAQLHFMADNEDSEKTLKQRDSKTLLKNISFMYKTTDFSDRQLLEDFAKYVQENISTEVVDGNEAEITFNKNLNNVFNTLMPLTTNQGSQTIKLSNGYTFTFVLKRDSNKYWQVEKIEFANMTLDLNNE